MWRGLLGMTRRMQHYDVAAWRPWMIVAAIGAVLIMIGIVLQVLQIAVSIRRREELRDRTGDPWDGRSLEWATASPPPVFNFAIMPDVRGEDAYWAIKAHAKQQELETSEPDYQRYRDAAQFADRICLRVLRHGHGLCADLAHLVDGRRGPCRRVRDLRGVRLARP